MDVLDAPTATAGMSQRARPSLIISPADTALALLLVTTVSPPVFFPSCPGPLSSLSLSCFTYLVAAAATVRHTTPAVGVDGITGAGMAATLRLRRWAAAHITTTSTGCSVGRSRHACRSCSHRRLRHVPSRNCGSFAFFFRGRGGLVPGGGGLTCCRRRVPVVTVASDGNPPVQRVYYYCCCHCSNRCRGTKFPAVLLCPRAGRGSLPGKIGVYS